MKQKKLTALMEQALAYEFAGREHSRWRLAASFGLDAQGHKVVKSDITALATLEWIDRLARRVACGAEEPFKEISAHYGSTYSSTKLGNELRQLCANLDGDFFERCAWPRFNPYITALLDAVQEHWDVLNDAVGASDPVWLMADHRAALDQVVRVTRAVTQSKKFIKKVENFDRASITDFQSGCRKLEKWFRRHSKLLIIRVDLYFCSEDPRWNGLPAAERAFKRLARHLREESVVPRLVGWIMRRETGFIRGVHYHLLVAIDGHRHRDGYGYAKKIGEHWVEKCCGPASSYYNCFDRREDYERDGLGVVHISDVSKLIGLREAMEYMTKAYFKVRSDTESRKSFRTSQTKDEPVKLGAPRHPKHDMSAVERILGKVKRSKPRYIMSAHKAMRRQLDDGEPFRANRFLAALVEALKREGEQDGASKRARGVSPTMSRIRSSAVQYPTRFG